MRLRVTYVSTLYKIPRLYTSWDVCTHSNNLTIDGGSSSGDEAPSGGDACPLELYTSVYLYNVYCYKNKYKIT